MEYLTKGFDPNSLTKPKLRSILASHVDSLDLIPPASAKKEALVEAFNKYIVPLQSPSKQSKASSSKGIDFMEGASPRRVNEDMTLVTPKRKEKVPRQQQQQTSSPFKMPPPPPLFKLTPKYVLASPTPTINFARKRSDPLLPTILSVLFLSIFTCVISSLFYIKFVHNLPYCNNPNPHSSNPNQPSNTPPMLSFKDGFYYGLKSYVANYCVGCPENGICSGGLLACETGYMEKTSWSSLGSICVRDKSKKMLAEAIAKSIQEILDDVSGITYCSAPKQHSNDKTQLTEQEIKNILIDRKLYSHDKLNEMMHPALVELVKANPQVKDSNGKFSSKTPRIPIICSVKLFFNNLWSWLWPYLSFFVTIALISFVTKYKKSKKKSFEKAVDALTKEILDRLSLQDYESRLDYSIPSALSVNQLRDSTDFPEEFLNRSKLWKSVADRISKNSNVRESLATIKGEQHRVWEWIGPPLNISKQSTPIRSSIPRTESEALYPSLQLE